MAERYTRLFALPNNLYSAGTPVILSAGVILKDNNANRILAQLKFKNISRKKIKALKICLNLGDSFGRQIEETVSYEYLDLDVVRDQEFGQKQAIYLPSYTARSFSVVLREVAFEDNSVWTGENEVSKPLSVQKPVTDIELSKEFQAHCGQRAKYKPFQEQDLWYCSCGAINHVSEQLCHICSNRQNDMLGIDWAALENEKKNRLLHEQEKREQEAKEAAAEAARRAKKTKRMIIVFSGIVLASILLAIITTKFIIPKVQYNTAMKHIDSGNYEEAYAILNKLGNNEAIDSNKYERAMALIDSGDYEAAYTLLEEIGNNEAIDSNKYDRAIALIDSGDYEPAYILLDGLNYKDSSDRLDSIKHEYRKILFARAEIGSYVFFGTYEQDNNTTNGKEDVEWLVLAKEDNKVLLISRYGLDCQKYNIPPGNVTWETCSLRRWLNGTFLNAAFSEGERSIISSVRVSADKNPNHSTNPGNSTSDQVFILSITDANKYFSSDSGRQCRGTAFCYAQGAAYKSDFGNCWWWLRSPGFRSDIAAYVDPDGSVHTTGDDVDTDDNAVRPALWINLGS